MKIVLDASVVGGWFFTEPLKSAADHYLHPQYTRFAPDFLMQEFTSIVRNKTYMKIISKQEGMQIIKDFHTLNALQLVPTRDLSEKAYQMAVDFDHAVYDCYYLAVAEQLRCVLVTADRPFFKVVKSSAYTDFVTWIEDPPEMS